MKNENENENKSVIANGVKIDLHEDLSNFVSFLKVKKGIVVSIGAEAIMTNDLSFKMLTQKKYTFTHADGEAAVLALKSVFKFCKSPKIAGVELWRKYIEASDEKIKVYLLGSTDLVLNKTIEKITLKYHNIEVVGFSNGYFNDECFAAIQEEILSLKPAMVLVALGQPKQEYIAEKLFHIHPSLYFCIGGSLDVYSGNTKRAPKLFIKFKLEWFYRLLLEPSRILRQRAIPKFILFYLFRRNEITRN